MPRARYEKDAVIYRQCLLVKGNVSQVSWLPFKFAKLGKTVKLKNEHSKWDNGWLIKEVWQEKDEPQDNHTNGPRKWPRGHFED